MGTLHEEAARLAGKFECPEELGLIEEEMLEQLRFKSMPEAVWSMTHELNSLSRDARSVTQIKKAMKNLEPVIERRLKPLKGKSGFDANAKEKIRNRIHYFLTYPDAAPYGPKIVEVTKRIIREAWRALGNKNAGPIKVIPKFQFLGNEEEQLLDISRRAYPYHYNMIGAGKQFVAYRDGKPVGYLAYSGNYIADMAVDPEHAFSGVGKKLLKRAVESIARHHDKVVVQSRAANLPATRFYWEHGFKITHHAKRALDRHGHLTFEGKPKEVLRRLV